MAERAFALGHFRWRDPLFHCSPIVFALLLIATASVDSVLLGQEPVSPPDAEEVSPFDGMVFYCTKCMTEVPEQLGAGSTCPHCGAIFESATNADGSETKLDPVGQGISLRVWSGIALVVLFAGEYFRRWRRTR